MLLALKPSRQFAGESGLPPLSERLTELLERLYGLYPVFNDYYFSHQARLAPVAGQEELPLG